MIIKPIEHPVFWSRWQQAPHYLGLIMAQVAINFAFLLSAIAIAFTDKIMMQTLGTKRH